MTLTSHQHQPIVDLDADALIHEARRLRRRRWCIGLSVGLLLVAGGTAWGLLATGGGAVGGRRVGSGGGSPPAPVVTAKWSDLTTSRGVIRPGATVTTVIRYEGHLIAAGDVFGPGQLRGLGCTDACNPVVWTSSTGAMWHPVLATRASGSIPGKQLVALPGRLLLFSSDEGSKLWTSTDGSRWQPAPLPELMEGMTLTAVASWHGRVVAAFSNKYTGGPNHAFGETDTIWTSTDGTHWHEDSVPDAPTITALTAAPSGFAATGLSRATHRSIFWRSSNGLTWTASTIGARPDDIFLGADSTGYAIEDISGISVPNAKAQLWRSSTGRVWSRGAVRGRLPTTFRGSLPPLVSTTNRFVALGNSPGEMWSSRDGRTWVPISSDNPPATLYQPAGAAPDPAGLLVIETSTKAHDGAPADTTTIWQVDLTAP